MDVDLARDNIKELLNFPTTKEYNDQKRLLKDDQLENWIKFNKKLAKTLELEVAVHQVDSVIELGWEPLNERQPLRKTKNGKLIGRWLLVVKKPNGDIVTDMPAEPDWVEKSFKPGVLAAVQKAFTDSYTRITVLETDGIKRKSRDRIERGFLNVEKEGVTVNVETDAINMLKYIPPKNRVVSDQYKKIEVEKDGVISMEYQLNKKGNRIKLPTSEKRAISIPEKWFGYCKKSQKSYTLTSAFVKANFPPGYIEQCIVQSKCQKAKFINVPPGRDTPHKTMPESLLGLPLVHYKQVEGQRTCLTYSFASALHHVGAKQVASEVVSKSKKIIEKFNTIPYFLETMQKQSLNLKRLKANAWNILKNEEKSMVVVTLRGSDGEEDHCVTVLGNWIFDSNFPNALPLTKDSLDLCCSSEDRAETFVEVVHALLCTNYMDKISIKSKKKKKRKY